MCRFFLFCTQLKSNAFINLKIPPFFFISDKMSLFLIEICICREEERKGQPSLKTTLTQSCISQVWICHSVPSRVGRRGSQHSSPCHPAQSAGHSWESDHEGAKFSLLSRKNIFTHCTQQVGMVWFLRVTFAFTNVWFYI